MNKPDPRNIKMIAMLSHYHAPMQNSIRNPTKHFAEQAHHKDVIIASPTFFSWHCGVIVSQHHQGWLY
jgi:hypothetical protein